jgi:RNA polymerase sigma factor (sigma-70 family)
MLSICLALLENPEDNLRFEKFYNKFHSTVYLIAKEHLITNEAAEDCAQEIMIHFAKDFHNIKQDFNDLGFKRYVRVVSKCIAINMYRQEKKHLDNVVDTDISEFHNLTVEEFDVCDIITLKQAVDAMPEAYRYVFYLKYYGVSDFLCLNESLYWAFKKNYTIFKKGIDFVGFMVYNYQT